jgi:hypothetical protein
MDGRFAFTESTPALYGLDLEFLRPDGSLDFRGGATTFDDAAEFVEKQALARGLTVIGREDHPFTAGKHRWFVIPKVRGIGGSFLPETRLCPDCNGAGKCTLLITVETCIACGGSGFVPC